MGLDISHIYLTQAPEDKSDFLYIEDWELECNVPLEIYSKYIQEIDDLDFNKSIAIVENDKDLESLIKTESFFNPNKYLKIFIGKYEKDIDNWIEQEKFGKLERSRLGCEHNKLKYEIISFGEPIKSKVMYYIDNIGYQRKGMDDLYYELFRKFDLRGNKEDFELAYSCIGGKWYLDNFGKSAVDELKKNFEKHFIKKFEFGKSILWNSF